MGGVGVGVGGGGGGGGGSGQDWTVLYCTVLDRTGLDWTGPDSDGLLGGFFSSSNFVLFLRTLGGGSEGGGMGSGK